MNASNQGIRDIVFICHANPADNELTLWLSSQLAQLGYRVWSDVTRFFGGDWMWPEIEKQIRNNTIKFLYVSTKYSNRADGCMRELQLADSVRKGMPDARFIIPLRADTQAHTEANIYINGLYAIPFDSSWAKGFSELVDVLTEDNVPKIPTFNHSFITKWWTEEYKFASNKAILYSPEEYLSNWFSITEIPPLYFHELSRTEVGSIQIPSNAPYAFVNYAGGLLTFAPPDDCSEYLPYNHSISSSHEMHNLLIELDQQSYIYRLIGPELNRLLVILLKDVAKRFFHSKNLLHHPLSNNTDCYFFPHNSLSKRISVKSDSLKASRQLSGKYYSDYWHYALQVKPWLHSRPIFGIKSHILYSSDGFHIWESSQKLHRARRSHCKMWFNDKWRDLILITMHQLANGDPTIRLKVSRDQYLHVSAAPIKCISPVSYKYGEDFEQRILVDSSDGEVPDEI